jgi:hypothetical protein
MNNNQKDLKKERLSQALRDNLKKRKELLKINKERIKFLMDFHLMDMTQGFLMSSRYLQI